MGDKPPHDGQVLSSKNYHAIRNGKDSSNECDALGHPGRHHGEATQATVQSGRGPAAAKKQLGRNWMAGTPEPDLS